MAIGKESMARAAKAAAKKQGDIKAAKQTKTPQVKSDSNKAVSASNKVSKVEKTAPASNIESNVEKTASKTKAQKASSAHIVYQPSAQILERAALPNEAFAIGDAMPVYYL